MKTVNSSKDARFDMRISEKQKELYKKASEIKGFKSISNFIKSTMNEKVESIINENERILASEKDKEVFFNAIFSNIEPNEKLKNAAKTHKKLIKE